MLIPVQMWLYRVDREDPVDLSAVLTWVHQVTYPPVRFPRYLIDFLRQELTILAPGSLPLSPRPYLVPRRPRPRCLQQWWDYPVRRPSLCPA